MDSGMDFGQPWFSGFRLLGESPLRPDAWPSTRFQREIDPRNGKWQDFRQIGLCHGICATPRVVVEWEADAVGVPIRACSPKSLAGAEPR